MMTTPPRELAARLADLLSREHLALGDFLVALADFDRQRGWLELGYAGLFPFLHRDLGLSKSAAFYRKTAAELIQRFPEIVEPIRDGRLCLTSIVEVAKVLTLENREQVLPRFFHCSKQEAQAVSAELAPDTAPPLRTVVTALPAVAAASIPARLEAPAGRSGASETPRETMSQTVLPEEPPRLAPVQPPAPLLAPAPRTETVPLTADLRRLHVTVSKRFLQKLEAARAALSHSLPGASAEDILEAGLDLVLARDAKRKGLVAHPRPPPPPGLGSDDVPAHVAREVWTRDQGRCQWPLEAGGVCGSTIRCELDHIEPKALGGPPTAANLRVLCDFHNDLSARRVFGDAFMDRFRRRRASS